MLQILYVVSLVTVIASGLVTVYFAFFMVLRLCGVRSTFVPTEDPQRKFAIVVPAHNEEAVIADTLHNLMGIDYPKTHYEVFVVADNCTDRTASITRSLGVQCLERTDLQRQGKGYALCWAIQELLPRGCDAFVICDADCTLQGDVLRILDAAHEDGFDAVQMQVIIANADESPISFATAVGKKIEYEYYYAPKSRLGLTVSLDSGHSLRADLVRKYLWDEKSIVEDAGYMMRLASEGIAVRLATNANVCTLGPRDTQQLRVQRSRWATGTFSLARETAWHAIASGMRQRSVCLVDAAWMLLVLNRAVVLGVVGVAMVLARLTDVLLQSTETQVVLVVSFGLALMQILIISCGVSAVGLSWRRVRLLLLSPVVVFRLIGIAVNSMLLGKTGAWVRTPRDSNDDDTTSDS